MIFEPTKIDGAWTIDLDRREDERGYFARSWCRREFEARGLTADLVQSNFSYNYRKGTIRGMHYQVAPSQEAKLVRCIRGSVWDVIVDLRPESPTYLEWVGVELSAENHRQLYIPEHCAHGYQTLADDTEVLYHVSEFYVPDAERGIRWNDPQLAIRWPENDEPTLSPKDRAWPDFIGEASAGEIRSAVGRAVTTVLP
jgi:dTDP-4-dehydrorhamnose 3,5-epimerase